MTCKMEKSNPSAVLCMAARYPQLLLPIRVGEKDSVEYRNAVRRGIAPDLPPEFKGSPRDSLTTEATPAGEADILTLGDREDFVHAYRALAYKCEPMDIPPSVGAATIKGLINWEKIHRHESEYRKAGGTDWAAEFRLFTSVKRHYSDTVILLSDGFYSSVAPDHVGLTGEEWREKSYLIRKYHELTHFVCRSLYPENVESVRDEIIADMIGLIKAFGKYDTGLARLFLGIENGVYREGGRLSHYVEQKDLPAEVRRANQMIEQYAEKAQRLDHSDVFQFLLQIFP